MKSIGNLFSSSQRKKIKKLTENLGDILYPQDLTVLSNFYGSDKSIEHLYTPHYQNHFEGFRNESINLLEIGVGGYENPQAGGNSLRMWKRFFRRGNIFSIDIHDKSKLEEDRIRIFQGDQSNADFLESVVSEIGEIDIIIDDGSHINDHVIQSFKILFPKLKTGGIYVIEDVQTSYWPKFGGQLQERENKNTIMGFFKSLTDGLNHSEFLIPEYEKTYYDEHIISMHFYHNLIFIYKGRNNELSNRTLHKKLAVMEIEKDL